MELLIVDDEISALEAVIQNVNWMELPFERIHKASGMERAVKLLAENRDIKVMLSDIEMPMGSGLDLLEWVNANRSDVLCVFMTCHAEFEYARRALQLNSFDYILKPLDFDALLQVLRKAAAKVEQTVREDYSRSLRTKAVEAHFWRKLFAGEIPQNKNQIEEYMKSVGITLPVDGRFLPVMVVPFPQGKESIVEARKQYSPLVRNFCEQMMPILNVEFDIETLTDGLLIIVFSLPNGADTEKMQEELSECAVSMNEMCGQYLSASSFILIGEESDITVIPDQLEHFYQIIYFWVEQRRRIPADFVPFYISHRNRESVPEKTDPQNAQVAKVVEYINGHLQEELSIETLAELVYLNPDYLNRIFKKKMNITMSAYVVRQKIEHAQWLLRSTDLPIADVAAAVGYYNYSSFNRSFKRVTGKTPQEWKLGGR